MSKLNSIITIAIILSLFSCDNKQEGFIVKGQFDNAANKTIFLNRIQNNLLIVDSTKIDKNGNFNISGTFPNSELYLLQIENDPNAVIYLSLNNSTKLNLKGDALSLTDSYTVEGDQQGDNVLISEISKHSFNAQMKLKKINDSYMQNETLVNNQDSLAQIYRNKGASIIKEEKAYLKEIINNNIGSMATVWAIYQQLGREMILHPNSEFDYWKKVADGLQKTHPNSLNTKEINSIINQISIEKQGKENMDIGKQAPDFELSKPDGTNIKLSDLKGQYVLLDFWASWCSPCREENPNLINAYKQFNNKNFTIYQVSLDKDKEAWLGAIQKDNLSKWHHASDLKYWKSTPAKLYGVKSIPSNFLINPKGEIIAKNLRGNDLRKTLSKHLK